MGMDSTVVSAKLDDSALLQSIDNLVTTVQGKMTGLATAFNGQVTAMQEALNRFNGAATQGKSSNTETEVIERRAAASRELTKANNEAKMSFDQMAATMQEQAKSSNAVSASQQQLTNNAQRYTEEIRKQAQAIKESAQWKGKGFAMVNGNVLYDPERSTMSARYLKSLEEQILDIEKRKTEEIQRQEFARRAAAAAAAQEEKQKATDVGRVSIGIGDVHEQSVESRRIKAAEKSAEATRRAAEEYTGLEGTIARLLGVKISELNLTDNLDGAYVALSQTLRSMSAAYDEMTRKERDSAKGRELADKIQETSKAMSDIQKQKMRPISLDKILAFEPKTLDDITWKIQQLRSFKGGIDITAPNATKDIERVNQEIDHLTKNLNKYMSTAQRTVGENNALGRSWNYMKNRLAYIFTIGATTQFVKNLIDVRAQYEMNERALGILIDSAERGTQIFNELSQMALVSPYTLIELSTAAKQLTAYDIAARDVVDTTRRLADMASAVGVPIERLTYALGQIKAYGYLNARDARMFLNAGIPLTKALADHYTQLEGRLVSVGDVYDRIKKKAVDYNDVMRVVMEMTDEGGRFFDFQAKMAETLKVRLANLTLAWNNMLNDMGQQQQGFLSSTINGLKNVFLHWQDINKALKNLMWAFGTFKVVQFAYSAWLGPVSQRVGAAFAAQYAAGEKLTKMFTSLANGVKSLGAAAVANWQIMAVAAAAYVAIDIVRTAARNRKAIMEFNEEMAKSAEEASKALGETFSSESMRGIRAAAAEQKLTAAEAAKAWDMLREGMENTAASGREVTASLLSLDGDMNDRIVTAFRYADALQEVQQKMAGLYNEIRMHQDSALGGLFGEGLMEDLEDYQQVLDRQRDVVRTLGDERSTFWERMGARLSDEGKGWIVLAGVLGLAIRKTIEGATKEAGKEVERFAEGAAQTVRELLGEDIFNDALGGVKVAEAFARLRQQIVSDPRLGEDARQMLLAELNKSFKKEFGDLYDDNAIVAEMFLDKLKRDYGSAFSDITEDILKKQDKWGDGQEEAFRKTAERLKEAGIPEEWSRILDQMLADMDSRDFAGRVLSAFGTAATDDVQRWFRESFLDGKDEKERTENLQKYGTLMRKMGEDNVEYEKRISEEREKQEDILQRNLDIVSKQGSKEGAVARDAQAQVDAARRWLDAMHEVERLGGYNFTKDDKDGKTGKTAIGEALKKEVQLVNDIRKRYDEYRKMGVSSTDAMRKAADEYRSSLASVNDELRKMGLATMSNEDIAKTELKDLKTFYERQLKTVQQTVSAVKDFNSYLQGSLNMDYDVDKTFYENARNLVAANEGFRGEAYWNPGEYLDKAKTQKRWTVGYGFTELITRGWEKVVPGTVMTEEEAEAEIEAQLKFRLNKIRKLFEVYAPEMLLTKEQIRTYLDFAFQSGGGPEALLRESMGDINKIAEMLETAAYDRLNDEQRADLGKGVLARDKARQQSWIKEIGSEAAKPAKEAFDEIMLNFDDEVDAAVVNMKKMVMEGGKSVTEIGRVIASGKEVDAIETLEKAIAGLNVRIAQVDYRKITDGLNDELGRLKDGYELAVELDANPELAKMFTNMLDIDTDTLPRNLDTYAARVTEAMNMALEQEGKDLRLPTIELSDTELAAYKEMSMQMYGDISEEDYALIERKARELRDMRRKEAADMLAQAQELRYKLADLNGKIAEEEKKLAHLQSQYQEETLEAARVAMRMGTEQMSDEEKRRLELSMAMSERRQRLLSLMIQDQQDAIRKLQEDALEMMPFYMRLFDGISGKSRRTVKGLVADARTVLSGAVKGYDARGNEVYTLTQKDDKGNVISRATVSARKYQETIRKVNEEAEKVESAWEKIRRLTDDNKKNGEDWSEALSLIGGEMDLIGEGVGVIGEMFTALGAGEETQEVFHDVQESIKGIGTAAKGVSQIMKGDFIGGIVNVIKGVWDTIASWFDNTNKKIDAQVKASERSVRRLDLAYAELQWQVGKALGEEELQARRAAIANRQLALEEKERQLALEESREEKYKDEEAIEAKRQEVDEARRELTDSVEEITTTLLGSDVKAAAEDFVGVWLEAWRSGEATMEALEGRFDDMVDTMVTKSLASRLVAKRLQAVWDMVDSYTGEDSEGGAGLTQQEIRRIRALRDQVVTGINTDLTELFGALGIGRDGGQQQLSALQQGIQGITEDQAGALEAYWNANTQQQYTHTGLLTEIRDTLVAFDFGAHLAMQAQMLLQLQQSYQVQVSIQRMMEGWTSADGRGVRVEMVS